MKYCDSLYPSDPYRNIASNEGGAVTRRYPNPQNPIGFSVFQSYNAVIKQVFREQQANHRATISNFWEHVWLPHFN